MVPRGVYPEVGARIMDLQEPTKKMSTTGGTPQGTVLLLDEPDVIRKKFRSAVTDSGREVRRGDDKPGVTNLIDILAALTGEPPDAIEAAYGERGLRPVQAGRRRGRRRGRSRRSSERYRELRADPGELRRLLAVGAEKAREASAPTLAAMYERMGFVKHARPGRFFGARSTSAARELAPLARLEPAELEPRVDAAVQAPHPVADRLDHPPHLPVPALVQHELEAGARRAGARGRAPSARPRARRLRPACAASRRSALPGLDLVDLLHAVARDARAGARAGRRSSAAARRSSRRRAARRARRATHARRARRPSAGPAGRSPSSRRPPACAGARRRAPASRPAAPSTSTTSPRARRTCSARRARRSRGTRPALISSSDLRREATPARAR